MYHRISNTFIQCLDFLCDFFFTNLVQKKYYIVLHCHFTKQATRYITGRGCEKSVLEFYKTSNHIAKISYKDHIRDRMISGISDTSHPQVARVADDKAGSFATVLCTTTPPTGVLKEHCM